VTHDGITNGISVALLAAVAMWAAPGHADWRKTGMTTGDYRKDAQSDVRDLSKPRPNDPPPTTAGAGGRVTKVQGSTIYVDLYPGYVVKLEAPRAFKDVVIGDSDVIDTMPGGTDRDLIIQAKVGGGGTNIMLLDGEGLEIANVIVTAVPSWRRFNEGKVQIYNKHDNLPGYTNYQCAPTCVRIEDKYEGSDRPKPPSTVISIGDYTFRNGHTNSDTPTGTRTPGR
jgi:hypothetical protein